MRIGTAGLLAGVLIASGCSSTSNPASPNTIESGALSLTELVVDTNLKAAVRYDVAIRYEGDPSSVREVCFLWSGEGPFCWRNFVVDAKHKLIRTQAVTRNPNSYRLTGFVRYGGGNTNRVSKTIRVKL